MELEHCIVAGLGFVAGMLVVLLVWMRSPDFADAERYRWLKATTNFVTNGSGERIDMRGMPGVWDEGIDRQRAQWKNETNKRGRNR